MTAISKKAATSKKSTGGGKTSKTCRGVAASTKKSARKLTLIGGVDKRYAKSAGGGRVEARDEKARALNEANKHMERAWEKIYARR